MDYRRVKDKIFLRLDKGEDIQESVIAVCRREKINSAVYHGIGACSEAVIATYIPEDNVFLEHKKEGMLEMISLEGNITHDDAGELLSHAHVMYSYMNDAGKVEYFGGHLISAVTWFTAEMVVEPYEGEGIGKMKDPWSEVMVWKFPEQCDKEQNGAGAENGNGGESRD